MNWSQFIKIPHIMSILFWDIRVPTGHKDAIDHTVENRFLECEISARTFYKVILPLLHLLYLCQVWNTSACQITFATKCLSCYSKKYCTKFSHIETYIKKMLKKKSMPIYFLILIRNKNDFCWNLNCLYFKWNCKVYVWTCLHISRTIDLQFLFDLIGILCCFR